MSQTAERILRTALRLFAAEGYEAASISRIAGELSLSKAAMYRHFASKQALLEAILARMEQRDAEQARAFELPEGTPESMREAYEHSELGSLIGRLYAGSARLCRVSGRSDGQALRSVVTARAQDTPSPPAAIRRKP